MDLLKSMNHRLNLLDEMNQSLAIHDRKNTWEISELDTKTTFELKQLKEETKSILEECNTIHKAVFNLGSQLRQRVSNQELQAFKTDLDEWKLEEYIHHKELNQTFYNYAKRLL